MRRIGYGFVGILLGVIIYILMLSQIPDAAEVKSTLSEFGNIGNVEMEPEEDLYDGYYDEEIYEADEENLQDNTTPFLQHGSYHVSVADFKDYENKNIVKYGKVNPMFYFVRQLASPEETEEGVLGVPEIPGSTETPDIPKEDSSNNGKPSEGNQDNKDETKQEATYHMGFNIDTNKEEAQDVSAILESFNKYGRLPVDEKHYNVVSGFGTRIDPFENVNAYHTGIDIANIGIDKSNIYSALHGEVSSVASDPEGYGNYITVKHDGFETLYAHMNSMPLFKPGDKVYAGDILGYVGSTGRSTGPHLHFEVNVGDVRLNPALFMSELKK